MGKLRACLHLNELKSLNPTEMYSSSSSIFGFVLAAGVMAALSIVLVPYCVAQQTPAQETHEDLAAIIQKSVQANNRDWDAAPNYDNEETDRDADGSKTYQVTTVLGSPYERLIAINGKELTGAQRVEQQKKYEQMLAHRKAESPAQRSQRIAKYQASRRRDHQMLQQLTKAFDFASEGQQTLGDRKVYVLKATPRPGYKPPNRDTQVLPGMEGKLWIDSETYQWVKVEAHVIRPVSIEGFLAQVEPGTRFELEKAPVGDNIWLPKHYAMSASAKVFFLVPHHSHEDDTYFNYRKSQNSSAADAQPRSMKDQYANSRSTNP